jgi:hypothetical protein
MRRGCWCSDEPEQCARVATLKPDEPPKHQREGKLMSEKYLTQTVTAESYKLLEYRQIVEKTVKSILNADAEILKEDWHAVDFLDPDSLMRYVVTYKGGA